VVLQLFAMSPQAATGRLAAGVGYDMVTGIGVPDVAALIAALP
jgi:hypothetical protein